MTTRAIPGLYSSPALLLSLR